MTASQFETLTRINLQDVASSFGLQNGSFPARILRKVVFKYAQAFARQMTDFDVATGSRGLAEGARLTLRRHFEHVRLHGAERIPASGFLALSNHPGLADTLATFAALNRPDLKIIAQQRPFLEALTNVSKHLFYVTDDPAARMALVRQVSVHLRNGGAVLTYPAGKIEPDPDFHADAVESLQSWTDSAAMFARMAPGTPILPVVVRGVVSKQAITHPLTRIRRTRMEREALAAAYQVFLHLRRKIKDLRIRVQIGKPIYASEFGTTEARVIHRAVLAEMRQLIENPPLGEGLALL
jgi:1-acyl-sn-glycerol-3-phosphate acyltransferase